MLHLGTQTHTTVDLGHPVTLSEADRAHGIYILGKSGTGKSTLLENFMQQDAESGLGFCLIEPHRDLVDRTLEHIPKRRAHDTVVIDLADVDHPVPFNVLSGYDGKEYRYIRPYIVSTLITALKKIYADNWSATRMERVLRHTIAALLEYPHATLLSIPRMLTETHYRHDVLEHVSDPVTRNYWRNEYERKPKREQSETAEPILNRIEQLFMHPLLRHVLCQPENTFDLKKLMDNHGIILVNLAAGTVGEEAAFLGSMLISYLYSNALRRDPHGTPPAFTCYIDEFADLATTAFTRTLSTCRKFGLRFVIAHQYLDQLPRDVRSSIFGNIGTTLFFQVGSSDADLLEREGYFETGYRHFRRLGALPFGTMHAVLLQNGSNATHQIQTEERPEPRHCLAQFIKEHSRTAYAMPSADIESYIRDWYEGTDELPHIRINA
jgi:hypothetical protein